MLADYYLHTMDPTMIPLWGNFGIRWYGFSYVLGFLAGWWLMRLMAKKGIGQIKENEVTDFITLAALVGVMLGGRLGYMLFYDFEHFVREPWTLFLINQGGMASHGGILGLVIFTGIYAKVKGYNWPGVGDNLVAVAPLGIFFGRMANFINGELYGKPAAVPWAMKFPAELERPGIYAKAAERLPDLSAEAMQALARTEPRVREVLREVLTPRHPSQIYQGLMEGLLLFLILFIVRMKFKRLPYGILTGMFFIGYATFRILGELFREPDFGKTLILGVSRGQFYSIFMYAVGAAFIVYGVGWGRKAVRKSQA